MKKVVCVGLLFLSSIASAQEAQSSRFEITPFVGYMRGGSIRIADSYVTQGDVEDVKIEESGTWGVKLDQALGSRSNTYIQYLVERAQSQLEDNRRLFGEEPSGPVPPGSLSFTDTSTTYLHVGLLRYTSWTRTDPYELRPYFAGGIGVTQLSFHEIPLDDQTRPSVNLGAGIRWTLSERMAIRLEARAFYTNLNESEVTVPAETRDCIVLPDNPCIRTYSFPSSFFQADITAGLSWKF